jgi:osmoprotectant transport system permease protein
MPDPSTGLISFVRQQSHKLLEETLVHIGLTFSALLLAILIGVSLGVLISRRKALSRPVLGLAGILQTIPSIALLGFMIPLLGIGPLPAIVALFLYALLPIIRNTYTGITGVRPSIIEAARGMGMTDAQVMRKVQLPLAMPVILAGIRTATVITVGVATLAAYIAAGGLGEFIFGGIALNNTDMILAGAIPAALLAILLDWLLSLLQRVKVRTLQRRLWAVPAGMLLFASLYILPTTYEGKLTAGFTPEFMGRQDGDMGLKTVYGLRIRTLVINDNIMYTAAYHKKVDVISGSSTDGRVKAFNLSLLRDDKHIFPPYYAAPIVRRETLDQYPEMEPALGKLSGIINDSIMGDLNYRVDYLKESPDSVAREFLRSKGLLRNPNNGHKATVTIGSKIFGDGYILSSMYKMLLDGYTDLHTVTRTGLGGTTICFNALVNKQIDMYPEYTGTGLLVILQSPPRILDSLGHDPRKVYDYVHAAFLERYGIQWLSPIGFNNTYALMMRKEQSEALDIKTISQLSQYNR